MKKTSPEERARIMKEYEQKHGIAKQGTDSEETPEQKAARRAKIMQEYQAKIQPNSIAAPEIPQKPTPLAEKPSAQSIKKKLYEKRHGVSLAPEPEALMPKTGDYTKYLESKPGDIPLEKPVDKMPTSQFQKIVDEKQEFYGKMVTPQAQQAMREIAGTIETIDADIANENIKIKELKKNTGRFASNRAEVDKTIKEKSDYIKTLTTQKKDLIKSLNEPHSLLSHVQQVTKENRSNPKQTIAQATDKFIENNKIESIKLSSKEDQTNIFLHEKVSTFNSKVKDLQLQIASEKDPTKKKKLHDKIANLNAGIIPTLIKIKEVDQQRKKVINDNIDYYLDKLSQAKEENNKKDIEYWSKQIDANKAFLMDVYDQDGKPNVDKQADQAIEIIKANKDEILKFRNLIPENVSPQKALEIYYSAVLHRLQKVNEERTKSETLRMFGNIGKSLRSGFWMSENEKQREADEKVIKMLAPIVYTNRMSDKLLDDKQRKTSGNWLQKAFGNIAIAGETAGTMALEMNARTAGSDLMTQAEAGQTIMNVQNETGIEMGDAAKIAEARSENLQYSAADFGNMLGPSLGLIPSFITGAAAETFLANTIKGVGLATKSKFVTNIGAGPEILERVAKTGKITNAFGQEVKGGNLLKAVNAKTKVGQLVQKSYNSIVKGTAGAIKAGTTYEFAGLTHFDNQKVQDEAEFWSGFLGVPGKAIANAAIKAGKLVIPGFVTQMFGKNSEKVMNYIASRIGSGLGETGEEVSQTLWQIYRDSENSEQAKKQYAEQFGTWNDALHFFTSTMLMGMAMGEGSEVGKNMAEAALNSYQRLDAVDKKTADKVINRFETATWLTNINSNISAVKNMNTNEIIQFSGQATKQRNFLKGNKNTPNEMIEALDAEISTYNDELQKRNASRSYESKRAVAQIPKEAVDKKYLPLIDNAKKQLDDAKSKGIQESIDTAQKALDDLTNEYTTERKKAISYGIKNLNKKRTTKQERIAQEKLLNDAKEKERIEKEKLETDESKAIKEDIQKKVEKENSLTEQINDLSTQLDSFQSNKNKTNQVKFDEKIKTLKNQIETINQELEQVQSEKKLLNEKYEAAKIKPVNSRGEKTKVINKKFKGKIIYATPASGKTYFKKQLEGTGQEVIDSDDFLLEEMQKSAIVQKMAMEENRPINLENMGSISYNMHSYNNKEIIRIYDVVREKLKQAASEGKVVLTGSAKLQKSADYVLTKKFAQKISEDANSQERENKMGAGFTASRAQTMLDKERKRIDEAQAEGVKQEVIDLGENEYVADILTKSDAEVSQPATKTLLEQIDSAAQETNPNPTEEQKKSGNYKKGKVKLFGLTISIETAKGVTRSGVDQNGKSWSITMKNHYGYINKTEGRDGDEIDVFFGNNPESDKIFVVDQIDPETGKFDEHKVMIGFNTIEEAEEAYMSNYSPGWKGFKQITETNVEFFKKWIESDGKRLKPFAEYKSAIPEYTFAPISPIPGDVNMQQQIPFADLQNTDYDDPRVKELHGKRNSEIMALEEDENFNANLLKINQRYEKLLRGLNKTIRQERLLNNAKGLLKSALRYQGNGNTNIAFLPITKGHLLIAYRLAETIFYGMSYVGTKMFYNVDAFYEKAKETIPDMPRFQFNRIMEFVNNKYLDELAEVISDNAITNNTTIQDELEDLLDNANGYMGFYSNQSKGINSADDLINLIQKHKIVLLDKARIKKFNSEQEYNLTKVSREVVGETGAQKLEAERKIYRAFFKTIRSIQKAETVERYIVDFCKDPEIEKHLTDETTWNNFIKNKISKENDQMVIDVLTNIMNDNLMGFNRFISMHNFYKNIHLIPARTILFQPNAKKKYVIQNINQEDRIRELENKVINTVSTFTHGNIQNNAQQALKMYFKEVRSTLNVTSDENVWAEILQKITGIESTEWIMFFHHPSTSKKYAAEKKGQPGIVIGLTKLIDSFQTTQHIIDFFNNSTGNQDSNIQQLVNISIGKDKLALNYAGVDGKRKTSFEQSSDFIRSMFNILKPNSFLDNNIIAQIYRKAHVPIDFIKFMGMANLPNDRKTDIEGLVDNDLNLAALIMFANADVNETFIDENGSQIKMYYSPAGQFGDKDQSYMIKSPYHSNAKEKYLKYLQDHPEEAEFLANDSEIKRAKIYYTKLLNNNFEVLGTELGSLIKAGDVNEAEVENFIYNYALNKIYTDQIVHGDLKSYYKKNAETGSVRFDLTDMVKRGGSTNSPGYTPNTIVKNGVGYKSAIISKFKGFVGGFDPTGKGSPAGDGKDKAMRKVANGFIGEAINENGKTSTNQSAIEIQAKDSSGQTDIYYDSDEKTLLSGIENPTIIMLARNGELKGKPLSDFTKQEIRKAKESGAVFVVGDMPGVDSAFIDYLQEIGAEFQIYHTGPESRIKIDTPKDGEEIKTEKFTHVVLNTAALPGQIGLALQLDGIQFMSREWADRLAISMGTLYANLKGPNTDGIETKLSSVKAIFSDKLNGNRGLTKSNVICIEDLALLYPNSVYAEINNYMKKHNIDTLSFMESTKKIETGVQGITQAVGVSAVGKFTVDPNVKPIIIERNIENFFIQQDLRHSTSPHAEKQPTQSMANQLPLKHSMTIQKLWNLVQNAFLKDLVSSLEGMSEEEKRVWLLDKIDEETMYDVYQHVADGGSLEDRRYRSTIRGIIAKEIKKQALTRQVNRVALQEIPMADIDLLEYRKATSEKAYSVPINIYSSDKNGFEGLSNLNNGPVTYEINGIKRVFKTVEHAYQVEKALFAGDKKAARIIYDSKNGFEAQQLGRKSGIIIWQENSPAAWDLIAKERLEKIMVLAFEQNPKSKALLNKTGNAKLIHKSTKNLNLGRWSTDFPEILEKIRDKNDKSSFPTQMLFPEVDVNIDGIRYETGPFNSKKEAIEAIKNDPRRYYDMFKIDENGFFTKEISEVEIVLKKDKYYIPGSIITYTRIPADDLHSLTVARARKRITQGNFIITDRNSQQIAGSDFDGDKRFVEVPFYYKDNGKRFVDLRNDSMKSNSNRAMFLLALDYQDPANKERVTRPIDLTKYNRTAENLRLFWSAKGTMKGASKNGKLNDSIALADARNQNNVGRRVISILAKLSTAYEYGKAVKLELKQNKIRIPILSTNGPIDSYSKSNIENGHALTGFIEDRYGIVKNHIGILLNLALDNAKDPKIEMMGINEVTATMFAFALMTNKNLDKAKTPEEQEEMIIQFIDNLAAVFNTELYQKFIEYNRKKREVAQVAFRNTTLKNQLHQWAANNQKASPLGIKTNKEGEIRSLDVENLFSWYYASQELNQIGDLIDSGRDNTGDVSEHLIDKRTIGDILDNNLKFIDTKNVKDSSGKPHPLFEIGIKAIEAANKILFKNDLITIGTGKKIVDRLLSTLFQDSDQLDKIFYTTESLQLISKSLNEAFILDAIGSRDSIKTIGNRLRFVLNKIKKENNAFVNILDFTEWNKIELTSTFKKAQLSAEEKINIAQAFNNLPDAITLYRIPGASGDINNILTTQSETNGVANKFVGTYDIKQDLVTYIIAKKGISSSTWNGNFLPYISPDFFRKINVILQLKEQDWIDDNIPGDDMNNIFSTILNKHAYLANPKNTSKPLFIKTPAGKLSNNASIKWLDLGYVNSIAKSFLSQSQFYYEKNSEKSLEEIVDIIADHFENDKKSDGTVSNEVETFYFKRLVKFYKDKLLNSYDKPFHVYLAERLTDQTWKQPTINYMEPDSLSGEMLASADPEQQQIIIDRLMKTYPEVKVFRDRIDFINYVRRNFGYEGDFNIESIGMAFGDAVFIDPESAVQSTSLHEFSHLYWDTLPDDNRAKKKLLWKFKGDMEAAIIAIGQAGTNYMSLDRSKYFGLPALIRDFWRAVKTTLGVADSKDLALNFAIDVLNNKHKLKLSETGVSEVRNMIPDQNNQGYNDKRKAFFDSEGNLMSSVARIIRLMQKNTFNPQLAAINTVKGEQKTREKNREIERLERVKKKIPDTNPWVTPDLYTKEEFDNRVKEVLSEWDATATDGSAVHQVIEFLGNKKTIPVELSSRFAPGVIDQLRQDLIDWERRERPAGAKAYSEVKVSSDEHKMGGIIDRVWDANGSITIIDFKTGKSSKYDANGKLKEEYTKDAMGTGLKPQFQWFIDYIDSKTNQRVRDKFIGFTKAFQHKIQVGIYARLMELYRDQNGLRPNNIQKTMIVPIQYDINDMGMITKVVVEKSIDMKYNSDQVAYIDRLFSYNRAKHAETVKANSNSAPLSNAFSEDAKEEEYNSVLDLLTALGIDYDPDDLTKSHGLSDIKPADIFSIMQLNNETIAQRFESQGITQDIMQQMPLNVRLYYLWSGSKFIEGTDPTQHPIEYNENWYMLHNPSATPGSSAMSKFLTDIEKLKEILVEVETRKVQGHIETDDIFMRLFDMDTDTLRYFEEKLRRLDPILSKDLLNTINALLAAHMISNAVVQENKPSFSGYKLATVMLHKIMTGELTFDNLTKGNGWGWQFINDRFLTSKHRLLQYLSSEIRTRSSEVQFDHIETDDMMKIFNKCDTRIVYHKVDGKTYFTNPYATNLPEFTDEYKFLKFIYDRHIEQDARTRYLITQKSITKEELMIQVPKSYISRIDALKALHFKAFWYNRLFRPEVYDDIPIVYVDSFGIAHTETFAAYKAGFSFKTDNITDMRKVKKIARETFYQQASMGGKTKAAPQVVISGDPRKYIRWESLKQADVIATYLNTISRKHRLESVYPVMKYIESKYQGVSNTIKWLESYGGKMIFGKSLDNYGFSPTWQRIEWIVKQLTALTALVSLALNVTAQIINFLIGQIQDLVHLGLYDFISGWHRMTLGSVVNGEMPFMKTHNIAKELGIIDITNEHSYDKSSSNILKKLFDTAAFGLMEMVETANQGVVIASQLGYKFDAFDKNGKLKTAGEFILNNPDVRKMVLYAFRKGIIENKKYYTDEGRLEDLFQQTDEIFINPWLVHKIPAEVLLEIESAYQKGKIDDPYNVMTTGSNPFLINEKNRSTKGRFKNWAVVSKQEINIIENVSRSIHGDYGVKNSSPISYHPLGQAMMQFRRWIPATLMMHFASGYVDSNGIETRGVFTTLYDFIMAGWIKHKYISDRAVKKRLIKTNPGYIFEKEELKNAIKKQKENMRAALVADYEKMSLHDKMKAAERLIVNLDKDPVTMAKIYANMSVTDKNNMRKLVYMFTLMMAGFGYMFAGGDDDDEDQAFADAFKKILFQRTFGDMMYVVDPRSYWKLVDTPAAILRTIDNIGRFSWYLVNWVGLYSTSPEYRDFLSGNETKKNLEAWKENIFSAGAYKSTGSSSYSEYHAGQPKMFKYLLKIIPFGSLISQITNYVEKEEKQSVAKKKKNKKSITSPQIMSIPEPGKVIKKRTPKNKQTFEETL